MIKLGSSAIVLGKASSSGSSTFDGLTDKAAADIPTINVPLATVLSGKEITTNKKTDVDANKTSHTFFPSVKAVFDWVSGLFVKGAASSIDNAIARFDGTTGKILQDSAITIDDLGSMRVSKDLTESGFTNDAATQFILSGGGGNAYKQILVGFITDSNYGVIQTLEFGIAWGSPNLALQPKGGNVGIGTTSPTAKLDADGTSRFRGSATFNGQIIDNAGSSGTDGQVLKKVGGLVLWSSP